jgi:hypothetical protein
MSADDRTTSAGTLRVHNALGDTLAVKWASFGGK